MLANLVALILLASAIAGSLFLWFVYKKQYRFATLLFDMLPIYPLFSLLGLLISCISSIYLSISGFNLLWLLLPLFAINYVVQFVLFWKWLSSYRFKNYSKILLKLSNSPKIQIISINDWLDNPKKDPNRILVLIRHDVDISLNRAKKMFIEEENLKISSCYYFRNQAERYSLEEAEELIAKIASVDKFSIGFHYETITNARGDISKAIELFPKEVEEFRRIYPIRMVAAHGDRNHNGRLVSEKLVNLESLGLESAYQLPYDLYLSDSSGFHHFSQLAHDIYLAGSHAPHHLRRFYNRKHTLFEKFEVLDKIAPGSLVQILIHPDWWF